MIPEEKLALLGDISEKLVDTLISEANPANWSGGDKLPAELTEKERGNRVWDKKNAAATLTIAVKIETLKGLLSPENSVDKGAALLENELAVISAEKEVNKILGKLKLIK